MSFFSESSSMKTMNLLERGIDAAVLRHKISANNIANVDVPHFKRSDITFEAELKHALDSRKLVKQQESVRVTHPLHIDKRSFKDPNMVKPRAHIDYNSSMRNDGNNVDIESEVNHMVRNQLQYNLMMERLAGKFRHLNGLLRPSV